VPNASAVQSGLPEDLAALDLELVSHGVVPQLDGTLQQSSGKQNQSRIIDNPSRIPYIQ
jgi:hypothetical protein